MISLWLSCWLYHYTETNPEVWWYLPFILTSVVGMLIEGLLSVWLFVFVISYFHD